MRAEAIVVGAFAAGIVLAGCGDFGSEPDPPFNPDAPAQTISRTRIIWSENGRKTAVIRALTLERRERDGTVLKDSVQVDLYNAEERVEAIVTGRQGVIDEESRTARVDSGITVRFLGTQDYYATTLVAQRAHADDRTKQVIATGDVHISSKSGAALVTDQVVWDGNTQRFYAPGFVRLTNGTEVEEGTNLEANADLTQWTMQQVRGRTSRPAEDVRTRLRREESAGGR